MYKYIICKPVKNVRMLCEILKNSQSTLISVIMKMLAARLIFLNRVLLAEYFSQIKKMHAIVLLGRE